MSERDEALSAIAAAEEVRVTVIHHDREALAEATAQGYDRAMQHQMMSVDEQWHVSPEKWLARRHIAFLEGRYGELVDALMAADTPIADEVWTGEGPSSAHVGARAVIDALTKLALEQAGL